MNTDQSAAKSEPVTWEAAQAARIGKEVKRLRDGRPAAWLAGRAEELGLKMTRQTIADIENGRRRYVTTAELVVLAAALNTSPVGLLYPPPYDSDDEFVEVIKDIPYPKLRAAQWFSGMSSLPLKERKDRDEYQRNVEKLRDARRVWEVEEQLSKLVIPNEAGALRELALERAKSLHRELEELKSRRA